MFRHTFPFNFLVRVIFHLITRFAERDFIGFPFHFQFELRRFRTESINKLQRCKNLVLHNRKRSESFTELNLYESYIRSLLSVIFFWFPKTKQSAEREKLRSVTSQRHVWPFKGPLYVDKRLPSDFSASAGNRGNNLIARQTGGRRLPGR